MVVTVVAAVAVLVCGGGNSGGCGAGSSGADIGGCDGGSGINGKTWALRSKSGFEPETNNLFLNLENPGFCFLLKFVQIKKVLLIKLQSSLPHSCNYYGVPSMITIH